MSSIVLTDTTSAQISAALLKARRNAGSPSMGMVLTLIIVADEKDYEGALEAGTRAGREHPARILLVVTAGGRQAGLDAEVRLGEGTPGEVVVIRMRGAVSTHPASVIRPLLLPDSPVVIWWPGACPTSTANDELAQLAVRRLTDAAAVPRSRAALLARARSYEPGDTDLAWTRLTRWRGLLAAALDQYPARVQSVTVDAERGNPSADLLCAWLESRLKAPVRMRASEGPGITAVRMTTHTGDIAITRPDGLLASYTVPAQPERLVALKRREITDLISEELRRLDDDPIYEQTVKSLLDGGAPAKKTAAAGKTAASKTATKTAAKKSPAKKSPAKKSANPRRRRPRRRRPRRPRRRRAAPGRERASHGG